MATDTESKYVTDLVNAPSDWVAKGASTSHGAAVRGERMQVGEDVIFYVCKDTSAGIGEVKPLDGKWDGPRIEAGFQVDEQAERKRDFSS